mmetsp:Transcript_31308/g.67576  ORF Transcript_31308/g.67576 Transcript_31308/m.67576 type:complete len:293 (-) Transcript_31308:72-950(-)
MMRNVKSYAEMLGNQAQVCWLWRKTSAQDGETLQHFLDGKQYAVDRVEAYQQVYGHGAVCPGGVEETRRLVSSVGLTSSSSFIDLGCGVGGAVLDLADKFGARGVGVDVSANMLATAVANADSRRLGDRELAPEVASRVAFEMGDITTLPMQTGAYDLVLTRETLLHVADKGSVLAKCRAALKPGGRLVLTDYTKGEGSGGSLQDYVESRRYHLATRAEYEQLVASAGFRDIVVTDETARLVDHLEAELTRINDESVDLAPEARRRMRESWRDKLERARAGTQTWTVVTARA